MEVRSEPLAYFLSWTTYGTWLHGDPRGWVDSGTPGIQSPDPERHEQDRRLLSEPPVTLNQAQRTLVEQTIRRHCEIRGWSLHAVNVRSNHVHVVVTAPVTPETILEQFKAWCSRRLSEREDAESSRNRQTKAPDKRGKRRWWTEHGSTKWINDEIYFDNVVRYVLEGQ